MVGEPDVVGSSISSPPSGADQLLLNGYSGATDERFELTRNAYEHEDRSFLTEPDDFLEADSRFHGVPV